MVIKCNEEFQASGEIFWGSVAFSEPLIHAAELTSYHPRLDECMRNSFNFQLLKILWWGRSGISRALEVFLESWTNVPCPLESDCEVEVPNLGNGSAGWGRSMRGLAHDPCVWSTCLGIFVERMCVSSADGTRRLGLRGTLPLHQAPGTGHGGSLLEGPWPLPSWSLWAESSIQ